MKKLCAVLLSIIFFSVFYTPSYAEKISADCACVINAATGEVVYSKNIGKRHAMASTTKIMTAIIALENTNIDDVVTVSQAAASQEGSAAYIEEGMQIYMRDLIYGLMLSSGNDAAVAIAEHVAGSVESFVDMMNLKAQQIGADNTNFTNPSGLPDDSHFTTAGNLARIARYALQNPYFREIVGTKSYEAVPVSVPPKNTPIPSASPNESDKETDKEPDAPQSLWFFNHNKLLSTYEGTTGVKTGYTSSAGRCLVSSAKRDDMEFIAVTLGSSNDWEEHMQMLDEAFAEHYPKKVIEKGMRVKLAKVDGREYNMIAADDFIVPFRAGGRSEVELITHLVGNLKAPINSGEKIGYLEICSGGERIGTVSIVSESDINGVSAVRLKNSFQSCFMKVVRRILV